MYYRFFASILILVTMMAALFADSTLALANGGDNPPIEPLAVTCTATATQPYGWAKQQGDPPALMKADHYIECRGDNGSIAQTTVYGTLWRNGAIANTAPTTTCGGNECATQSSANYSSGCWYATTSGYIVYRNGTRKNIPETRSPCVTAP
jgi:hypothetical protein